MSFVRLLVKDSRKKFPAASVCVVAGLAASLLLGMAGCVVRNTTRVPPSQLPPPALEASSGELVDRINAQSSAIRTLVATVDLEPTAGSVYSGVIREYRDVKGFILVEKPSMIRMIGQAPVVRTNIFDMVSDGKEFRVYIPPKQKFIVGQTDFRRPAKNSLENLRPQHILDALLIPGVDPSRERYSLEEAEEDRSRFYVLSVVADEGGAELSLKRKIWFDRATLDIARMQIYGPRGTYVEDVRYSGHQDFQGVRYPTRIAITRPMEDYRLAINIMKATFNEPISPEKFELKKPAEAELVELSSRDIPEAPRGQ